MFFRFTLLLAISILMAGCASSQSDQNNTQYPNLISVNPPDSQQTAPSNVYVDSVKVIDYNKSKALLISGNMANGCTYLQEAMHETTADTLSISLKTWKPADKICSQALVPFSFIYDKVTPEKINTYSSAAVNQKSFKLKL